MKRSVPGIVIAGTGSGSGKTSIAAGMAAHLVKSGFRVQTFKAGPDYLDPTWLTLASGRQCLNLDSWMTNPDYIKKLYEEAADGADAVIIEGVMGLYDGADPVSLSGTTAEIAMLLDLPVFLIVNVKGMAGTVSAVAEGMRNHAKINLKGIIANYCSSERHRDILNDSLRAAGFSGLSGYFAQDDLACLPSRHLGLKSAFNENESAGIIESLSAAVGKKINIYEIFPAISSDEVHTGIPEKNEILNSENPQHDNHACIQNRHIRKYIESYRGDNVQYISAAENQNRNEGTGSFSDIFRPENAEKNQTLKAAVAWDEAFAFYYPDNLKILRECGIEIVFFSPLHDPGLPDADLLYLGGGYPEIHAEELSKNESMRKSINEFYSDEKFIYAECGGLMYLSRSIETLDAGQYAMAGIFDFSVRMLPRRKALGYVSAVTEIPGLFPQKISVKGHEYHYSEIAGEDSARSLYAPVYNIAGRKADKFHAEGYISKNTFASYVHLHFASNPEFIKNFIPKIKSTLPDKNPAAVRG